jgi:transcriptional regulator with XRE-family HTH domain
MKDRIKKVREVSGLNLTRFADALKTSVATVSRYESGERIPSDAVVNLICQKFGVSYAWLKTGEGPMEDPLLDDAAAGKILDSYRNMPERLRMLVDALVEMDPEWWKTLDAAFAEIERRKKGG